ncbi:hypothetical protein CK203_011511 [Vitis vinifera]|uniref:Uncharacterized protein n=1 Tax=Vitis vinifera TaxID=29760 RepID=A0A438JUA4_VITVI|nr:hypothetical protein CK203_011511 [Vitis vinifera]
MHLVKWLTVCLEKGKGNHPRCSTSWCGDESLCVSFPFLYPLAISREAWVTDLWVKIVWEVIGTLVSLNL